MDYPRSASLNEVAGQSMAVRPGIAIVGLIPVSEGPQGNRMNAAVVDRPK